MSGQSPPEVRHADVGGVDVAYQLFGSGKSNYVFVPWSVTHLDYMWAEPGLRALLERLGEMGKVAVFDKRGTGLSGREGGAPNFDERMEDIEGVMDAAGFDEAFVVAISEGGASGVLFAATHPKRVRGLVVISGSAKGSRSKDYPYEATEEQYRASFKWAKKHWGDAEWRQKSVAAMAPSRVGDSAFTGWLSDMRQAGATQEVSLGLGWTEMMTDVRELLPFVRAPALVMSVVGDRATEVGEGRLLAERIPDARFVELPGVDHMFFADRDLVGRVADEVGRFVSAVGRPAPTLWAVATVMSASIVDSDRSEGGDQAWQGVLQKYYEAARTHVGDMGGREARTSGGLYMAVFSGAAAASKCAWAVARSGKQLGVKIHVGVHSSDCWEGPDGANGPAADVASAIMASAEGGEVLVSQATRSLGADPGIKFRDVGERTLAGSARLHLFSVEGVTQASRLPRPPPGGAGSGAK